MSEKRMVYAEDVIQRIRDMAPEILGGWYNPYMENELEQLVCIVESTPTAAVPDVQRWRKTAEEPPTEKDSAHGKVLVKYMDALLRDEVDNEDIDNQRCRWSWALLKPPSAVMPVPPGCC